LIRRIFGLVQNYTGNELPVPPVSATRGPPDSDSDFDSASIRSIQTIGERGMIADTVNIARLPEE